MQSIYFGGSRHLGNLPIVAQVVGAVVKAGHSVHVGCQFGADAQVITAWLSTRPAHSTGLHMFAVSQTPPPWFSAPAILGASVTLSAGGTSAPIPARYLLRSIAAFQGCAAAVFFQPGHGSLAVAREAIRAGLPVYAINPTAARYPVAPLAIPSTSGSWVRSLFLGRFLCWHWSAPAQLSLF